MNQVWNLYQFMCVAVVSSFFVAIGVIVAVALFHKFQVKRFNAKFKDNPMGA